MYLGLHENHSEFNFEKFFLLNNNELGAKNCVLSEIVNAKIIRLIILMQKS
jgi:hypothetical protein